MFTYNNLLTYVTFSAAVLIIVDRIINNEDRITLKTRKSGNRHNMDPLLFKPSSYFEVLADAPVISTQKQNPEKYDLYTRYLFSLFSFDMEDEKTICAWNDMLCSTFSEVVHDQSTVTKTRLDD